MLAMDPRVADAVWTAIQGHLPPRPPDTHPLGCHRPRIPDRDCFDGILARLVTGCSWDVAARLCKASETTLRARRTEWLVAGVFDSRDEDEFDMLSPTAIEQLIDDVEEKFGSAEVVEVELNDTWARVFVPTGDGAARFRTYTYGRDGFSTSEAGGTLTEADPDLVDLTDLDADRLATNLAQARDELGIDGEVTTRVTVADDRMSTDFGTTEPFVMGERDAPPHVEIELVNEFMESASRTTDLSGATVLHETSYKAPTD